MGNSNNTGSKKKMRLLIASRNRNKLEEIRAIVAWPGIELLGVDDLPGLPPEIEEDADTFEGNALKKACTLCAASGLWTLADDSGLEVRALHGAPGVHSARYAGPEANYDANNRKLLLALRDVADRRARFRCVLALCAPDGRHWLVEGCCEGTIAPVPSGRTGFGYDPLFVPAGHSESFAAIPAAEKNLISHRARALAEAASAWHGLLTAADAP